MKRSKPRLSKFRIGTPVRKGEGMRVAVTRRPPRGVARDKWAAEGLFDVWFPFLAPSETLIGRYRTRLDDARARADFFAKYERELFRSAESRQAVELLAATCLRMPVSIGCFCEDEGRCHRSRLFGVIEREAARMAG